EPRIYIEEEEEQIRKQGLNGAPKGEVKPRDPAQEKGAAKDPEEVPPALPPRAEGVGQILQQIVLDVLTNPKLMEARDDYGTPGWKQFALADGGRMAWPVWFQPLTPGYQQRPVHNEKFGRLENRMLGVELSRFELKEGKGWEAPIAVVLFNAGGAANGDIPFL